MVAIGLWGKCVTVLSREAGGGGVREKARGSSAPSRPGKAILKSDRNTRALLEVNTPLCLAYGA